MVRINLIDTERKRKRRAPLEIQSQLVAGSALLSFLLLVLGSTWILLNRNIRALEIERDDKIQALEILKQRVKEVENYEEDKKKVAERIAVIEQLRNNQSIPVQLLGGVSEGIPARVWLTHLSANGTKVDLEGKAMTHGEIVDFVNRLKENQIFREVELIESRQDKEGDLPVYSFKLAFLVLV